MEEFIQDGKGIAFLPIKNDKLVPIEDVPVEKISCSFFYKSKTLSNKSLMNYSVNKKIPPL